MNLDTDSGKAEQGINATIALKKKATDRLFEPYRLNDTLTLKNRIVMAPLTRSKADDDLVPTEEIAAYYARRADAGLIITEATIVRADGQGYPNTPGIFNAAQIEGWRRVTDGVHAKGGKMFLQAWHVGRVSHPVYLDGALPIAPSAVPLSGRVPRHDDLQYGTPRALDTEEIPSLVEAFAKGAANALEAGFDGVEIHGANGYLIDQFLHHHTNLRDDAYGGTIEKMTRFALDVVDAVVREIGSARTGIRLSPGAYVHMEPDPRDAAVFRHLLAQLSQRGLAYVHTGIFDDGMTFDYLGGSATAFLRQHYQGTVIACGSYSAESAAKAIREEAFDLVAIGRPFIANPDYISKIQEDRELTSYDESMLASLI